LLVKLEAPAPDESALRATSREANKHLRETTKWIVGGILATAGAVMAGSSLTNLGSLDPWDDTGRLILAVGALAFGFFGIGLLLAKALGVFQVRSIDLERLKTATKGDWRDLKAEVEQEFVLDASGANSLAGLKDGEQLAEIEAVLPYLYIRMKFDRLVWWLPWTVLMAAIGFGTFAWAANPPQDPAPAPLLVLQRP
jgi:hypothetical protein